MSCVCSNYRATGQFCAFIKAGRGQTSVTSLAYPLCHYPPPLLLPPPPPPNPTHSLPFVPDAHVLIVDLAGKL